MKTIWCLFSVNDYNQPNNNLECWWADKPTPEMIAPIIGIGLNYESGREIVSEILEGREVDGYSLKEVKSNTKLL